MEEVLEEIKELLDFALLERLNLPLKIVSLSTSIFVLEGN